jgi:DNA invertase Pin-like site-specific DNA recombinase
MIAADAVHPLVTTAHRAKQACVYVRQSSLSQVTRHGESTDLQYHLVDRAVLLGWPRERVITIDDDLGKSGASADRRLGFQRLIAEIGLAHVGLVLSMDASRLARNNSDWYQLIELCSVFGTLIADTERVYDPRTYHDRLLLGLSGMMSEAELHHLRQRLQAGEWNKAARGDLRLPLPVGLIRLPGGEVTLHPDEEVQVRMRLVFERFRTLGTAAAVVRSLRRDDLPLPVRPLRGPAPHPVTWQPARSSMVLGILKNPAYAGTYVYGRLTYCNLTHSLAAMAELCFQWR